jgi:hypothetical protein
MIMHHQREKILCFGAGVLFVFAALSATVPATFAEILLFQDNFTSSVTTTDMNLGVTDPTRQTGPINGVTYTDLVYNSSDGSLGRLSSGDVFSGYVYLGHPDLPAGTLAMTGTYAAEPFPQARLEQNFNGALANGGMKISFDLRIDGPYWGGILIGADPGYIWGFTDQGLSSFGMQLGWYTDDTLSRYYGFDVRSGDNSGFLNLGVDLRNGALHHFDYVCSDPTDGNPFDGVGQTTIDCYLDGSATPFYSYTKTGGGYANNYISVVTLTNDPTDDESAPAPHYTAWQNANWYGRGQSYYSYWDNLTVSQIPEPSTWVLWALPGMVWALLRLRKK